MHGKTMREALNEVRSFRDATNEGGPGSGPQKSYKTIPKNETESEKDIRLDKATAVAKAANDKRISDAIKQFQKQDEKQKKKSGELKFRKYDTNEGGPGSGPQKGGKKFSSSEIKKAYGILNDPRYKQGNYSGAARAIDKLAPGLSNHPDVKNALKRANENLDLSATGDTTTSNASQEDIVEKNINEILPALAVGAAAAATGAAAYKAGGAIYKGVSNIKKKLSAYGKRTSNPAKESVEEATFSKSQIDALVKGFGPLGGLERNKIKMDKVAGILAKLPKDALMQLSKANLPMVSKIAKELMKEEIDEAVVGLPFSRTLMYIIKTDRNTAKKIKSFLADNGEKYPIYIDDNDSGQITLDAYNYTGGEKKAALAAAQAIAKKFNVKVTATR